MHGRTPSGQHKAAENEDKDENEADKLRQTDTFQGDNSVHSAQKGLNPAFLSAG